MNFCVCGWVLQISYKLKMIQKCLLTLTTLFKVRCLSIHWKGAILDVRSVSDGQQEYAILSPPIFCLNYLGGHLASFRRFRFPHQSLCMPYRMHLHQDRWSEKLMKTRHFYSCKPWHGTYKCRNGNALPTVCYYGNASHQTLRTHLGPKKITSTRDWLNYQMPERDLQVIFLS